MTVRRHRKEERGSLTVMIAVVSLFLFALAFMVAEGSRKLGNISRAQDIASEAARAAAATLDVDSLADGSPVIDEGNGRARDQAEIVIDAAGPGVELLEFTIIGGGTAAFVRVRVDSSSYFPGFDVSGTGSHRAQVIDPAEP